MSKLTEKPLFDACRNADGKTYNGLTALRWMHEALCGKPLSETEAEKILEEARARAKGDPQ